MNYYCGLRVEALTVFPQNCRGPLQRCVHFGLPAKQQVTLPAQETKLGRSFGGEPRETAWVTLYRGQRLRVWCE